MVTESRPAKKGGKGKKRYWEQVEGSSRVRLGTHEDKGKEEEEEEKHHGKAGNVERKGWGWSRMKMKSLCCKTGWEVCFVEKIMKGWTKKAVPTKVSSPPGLGLESKTFTLSITLVRATKHEK